jgi:putative intracellular protease/amidase
MVVIQLFPGCVVAEIMLAVEVVGRHLPTCFVTPDGLPLRVAPGWLLGADAGLDDAPVDDVRLVLIPGGDAGDVIDDERLAARLTEWRAAGASFGAICAAPVLLGRAGILKGRRFTHGFGDSHADLLTPYWNGAHFVDAPVVVDDWLVTAQPHAHIAFAAEVAVRIGVCSSEEGTRIQQFYRGERRRISGA